jgi:hypothetical protein
MDFAVGKLRSTPQPRGELRAKYNEIRGALRAH